MNAQRHVVKNVWRGWNITKHPLIVTPTGYRKDREEINLRNDEVSLWNDRFYKLKKSLSVHPQSRQLNEHQKSLKEDDLDSIPSFKGKNLLNFLQCSSEQIYAFCEGDSKPRLDLIPLQFNNVALTRDTSSKAQKASEIDVCFKLPKIDASVQTDLTSNAALDASSAFNELRNVLNEIGNEMAELDLEEEAVNFWSIAAKNGCAEAFYNLAMCYANGEYVPKNLDQARRLWEKASLLGHSLSTYQLAVCYMNGFGNINKNVVLGRQLMEKSAKGGCAEAQFFMASSLLLDGNLKRAEKYLLDAVQKKTFLDRVRRWVDDDSTPVYIKSVARRVITKSAF